MANTKPARGMRDFLPADVRKRNYVIGIIKEVYESYGFEPLETPAVENIETLTGKYGEEGNQLIFKILKRGEKLDANADEKDLSDLALRYDLTVPLARVVANHKNDLPKFFKRYQIQPVWRADRPARGRFREFYQCDVDAIGSSSMIVEAELCAAVSEILSELEFSHYQIHFNHRELLSAILNISGIEESLHTTALIAIDKNDKIGSQGVKKELLERGVDEESCDKLLVLFGELGKKSVEFHIDNEHFEEWSKQGFSAWNTSTLELFEKVFVNYNSGKKPLQQIRQILEFCEQNNASGKLIFNPSLARGLSYYTGAIFEISVPYLAGSLGGGGRYDGLIGMFGKEQIPACGFSLGLERILVVMEERGMFQKLVDEGKLQLDSADVMIASFDESLIGECLKLAGELRESGLRTLVFPEANQKIKPLKYAEQINVPFVCLVKESELAENKMTLKNLRTGEQETISREDIAKKIK